MQQDPRVQELLDQLQDIHAPAASWWPPAPGWWLLALALLLALGLLLRWQLRRAGRRRWVALAEAELLGLQVAFDAGQLDPRQAVASLSVLMRRAALAALGRERAARATDERWIAVIGEVGGGRFGRAAAELLLSAPYRREAPSEEQVRDLFAQCGDWLRGARRVRGGGHGL